MDGMKKYSKPALRVESFALSVDVASCAVKAGFTEYTCGVDLGFGVTLFLDANTGCTTFDWNVNDKACYNVPLSGSQLFSS